MLLNSTDFVIVIIFCIIAVQKSWPATPQPWTNWLAGFINTTEWILSLL